MPCQNSLITADLAFRTPARLLCGPAHAQGTRPGGPAVACRCCPGGIDRSTRVPQYPSDMADAEWQVIEPTLPVPAWKAAQRQRT